MHIFYLEYDKFFNSTEKTLLRAYFDTVKLRKQYNEESMRSNQQRSLTKDVNEMVRTKIPIKDRKLFLKHLNDDVLCVYIADEKHDGTVTSIEHVFSKLTSNGIVVGFKSSKDDSDYKSLYIKKDDFFTDEEKVLIDLYIKIEANFSYYKYSDFLQVVHNIIRNRLNIHNRLLVFGSESSEYIQVLDFCYIPADGETRISSVMYDQENELFLGMEGAE